VCLDGGLPARGQDGRMRRLGPAPGPAPRYPARRRRRRTAVARRRSAVTWPGGGHARFRCAAQPSGRPTSTPLDRTPLIGSLACLRRQVGGTVGPLPMSRPWRGSSGGHLLKEDAALYTNPRCCIGADEERRDAELDHLAIGFQRLARRDRPHGPTQARNAGGSTHVRGRSGRCVDRLGAPHL